MRWFVVALFALFFLPSAAGAWGRAGVYTVCEIAHVNLTPTTRMEVDRLTRLDGAYPTFALSCHAPVDPVRRASEHYINYPRSLGRVRDPLCPRGLPCTLGAIANDLAILRSPSAADSDKALALRFFGYWVGVVHNPFHVSFADDRGGLSIEQSGICPAKLHTFWDTCVLERRILAPGIDRSVRAREAAVRLNAAIKPAERRSWRRSEPWRWAGESYDIVRRPEVGYCVRKAGGCWYSATTETYVQGTPQRVMVIDDAYLDRAQLIVEDRLKRAGIRLAHELNRSFDRDYKG